MRLSAPAASGRFCSAWCILALLAITSAPALAESPDYGDTPATAFPLVLGLVMSGQHATVGDQDYFRFTAVADHLYVATIGGLTGLSDTVLQLYDTNGTTLLVEKDEIGQGEVIYWRAPRNGTFYLNVFQFFEDQTGVYTLTVTEKGEFFDDFGDTTADAEPILTDGSITAGNIEFGGDVDMFGFNVQSGHFYRVETLLLETGVDTVLRLFGSDGETVLAEDDQGGQEANASRIIFGATAAGFNYAEVSLFFADDAGGYAISATDELTPAELPADGTPIADVLATRDDIAIYHVETEPGHRYRFTASSGIFVGQIEITVLGEDRLTVLGTHGFTESATYTLPVEGDAELFVIVEEPINGGSYTLAVTDLGPPAPPVDLDGNGIVDKQDLLILSEYWLQAPPE